MKHPIDKLQWKGDIMTIIEMMYGPMMYWLIMGPIVMSWWGFDKI
jgi:hypothetical protein